MKTAIGFLLLVATIIAARPVQAQLVVPSYDRVQPFQFCGSVPQGDELSVPFDLVNRGSAPIIVDSAVAVGDTSDFYSNFIVGTNVRYLNPVMWKYINDKTIDAGSVFFSNFFFTPRTPGDKRLTITIYYHDATRRDSTTCSVQFHTQSAPAGLSFLYSTTDTVRYHDSIGYSSITYDRMVTQDSITRYDTVLVGDTLRAAHRGESRIDLSSCGSSTIVAFETTMEVPTDSFSVVAPVLPATLNSGDSTLVDFVYVPRVADLVDRMVRVRFVTNDANALVLRLFITTRRTSDVPEDAPTTGGAGVGGASSFVSLPNPFGSVATFTLAVPRASQVRLTIMDALGCEIATLLDEPMDAGTRELRFDAASLPAGVYFARCEIDGQVRAHRLVHVH